MLVSGEQTLVQPLGYVFLWANGQLVRGNSVEKVAEWCKTLKRSKWMVGYLRGENDVTGYFWELEARSFS